MTRGRGAGGARRKIAGGAAASLLFSTIVVALSAAPAGAITFSNSAPITIPAGAPGTTIGPATPYPSTISVSGLSGTITDVDVTLTGVTHTFPDDIDIIVVAPNGDDVVLWSGAGGGTDISGVNLTFDQSAAGGLPDGGPIVSGTFDPTRVGGDDFNGPPPAPGPAYSTTLSTFNGDPAGGTWSLFVFDDLPIDVGTIASGWSLDIDTTGPFISSFNPTSGPPGTSVQITGLNFSGTNSVRFGGVVATQFIENSPTQITATVPQGAVSGPIQVTTAIGTATSSGSFTVLAAAPTITSFSPGSGKVGAAVTILGTALTGATSVTFNGVSASVNVVNAGQINTTVPAGASTGPIAVTTAGGTGTSGTNFVVKHARSLTFSVNSPAKGKVSVLDGFNACRSDVPVKLQYLRNGQWRNVGTDRTNANGAFNFGPQNVDGKYRALAKKYTTSGDVCLKKKSPVDQV